MRKIILNDEANISITEAIELFLKTRQAMNFPHRLKSGIINGYMFQESAILRDFVKTGKFKYSRFSIL